MPLRSLLLALCLPATAHAGSAGGFLSRIDYALGVGVHAGVGNAVSPGEVTGLAEVASLEFRSYFSPRIVSHTTLNVGRMLAPAIDGTRGRLDYDLHLGVHLPHRDRWSWVIGPGAAIGYTFGRPGPSRFVADVRLGVDLPDPTTNWTLGLYVRPFVGWANQLNGRGEPEGAVTGGALLEVVALAFLGKRPPP